MTKDPYKVELADVALEVGANIVINYHKATIKFTNAQLQLMKSNNVPTDVFSCVMAGFLMSGKTEEELNAFLKEAHDANGELSVSFEGPDGCALNVKSKEENPMLDLLVQTIRK